MYNAERVSGLLIYFQGLKALAFPQHHQNILSKIYIQKFTFSYQRNKFLVAYVTDSDRSLVRPYVFICNSILMENNEVSHCLSNEEHQINSGRLQNKFKWIIDPLEFQALAQRVVHRSPISSFVKSEDPGLTSLTLVQVQSRNSTGSTPLHVAAYYGSRDMINILLESGAVQTDKNKVTQHSSDSVRLKCFQFGWLPGHYASRWSQPLDQKIAIGLKPRTPAMNSSAFSFRRIR